MPGVIVGPEDVRDAAERIAGRVRRTPVLELGEMDSASVVAKLELLQHTGSFKPRGAFNKLLSSEVPPAGVIAASGGNFGLAVAYAARETGVPAEIFIPATSPESKISRVRAQGARVTMVEGYFAEAQAALGARAAETGALMMHPFDQPEVIAGQGTIGLELDEQVPDVDAVLVAIGGGGLIAGVAAWFRRRVRVVGVETTLCATMTAALEAGGPVVADVGGIAADSLGSARVGDNTFPIVRDHVDRVVIVEDDSIRDAQQAYWDECRLIVEPGGAAALAALRSGSYEPESGCACLSPAGTAIRRPSSTGLEAAGPRREVHSPTGQCSTTRSLIGKLFGLPVTSRAPSPAAEAAMACLLRVPTARRFRRRQRSFASRSSRSFVVVFQFRIVMLL